MRLAQLLVWAAVAVALVSCAKAQADCSPQNTGDCRPNIVATALDGKPLAEDALAGKVVLVNFWATWCGPCAAELPALAAVYERHKARGFVIIGAISAEPADDLDVSNFAGARGVTYPLVRAPASLEKEIGLGHALPQTFLYDRKGKLRHTFSGAISERTLEAKVKELL